MRVLGFITTGVLAVVVVIGVIVFLMSIPDIARYMKIRKM